MGNFNRGDRFGGRSRGSSFGGSRGSDRGFGGRRDDRRPERHSAVCSECGANCTVPFRPTGDKPVLCDACFGNQRNSDRGHDRGRDRRPDRRSFDGDKKMFDAICDQCHAPCQVPFRPTGDKPVYCDSCFTAGAKDSGRKKGSDESVKQLTVINAKLDKIMKHLGIVDAPIKKGFDLEDIGEDLSIIIPSKEKKIKKTSEAKEPAKKKEVKKKVAVKKTTKKKKA